MNGGRTTAAKPIETYTIITTSANELVGEIHDRMPVILAAENHDAWLDPANQNVSDLKSLAAALPCRGDPGASGQSESRQCQKR